MIVHPIIPIWLMSIICIILCVIIIYNRPIRKINKKKHRINLVIKMAIVALLFVINLRFMIPNGESVALNSDLNILFVIDTSVSMRALDYNGTKERFEGVINDCCYIVDELASSKFSIITFGDTEKKLIPFTADTDMVQAELKSIRLENDLYAKGSSMNLVKDRLESTLKKEKEKQSENSKFVVFFISDGEITKESEVLGSFSSIAPYISNGAVMGYGTLAGGKMLRSNYTNSPSSDYIYYYDDSYKKVTAISKLDENNLKSIATDLGIDYIQMSKTTNIDYKLSNIKQQMSDFQTDKQKISSYQDIYYYFAIPLVILLMINFIIQKRRIG